MENEQELELLKINLDSYKKHSDWIAKGLVVYIAIIGTLFGIITKTEASSTITLLYIVIILASQCLIYFSYLIKVWVKKIASNILTFEKTFNCSLDHLYYPSERISGIILFIGIVVMLAAIGLFVNHLLT